LRIPLKHVSVRIGSSNLPAGPGSGGSMTAPSSAPAMRLAGEDARQKLIEIVAKAAGCEPSALSVEDGSIVRDKKPLMSWTEACGKMSGESLKGNGTWDRQKSQGDGTKGHSNGVQFVEVEVDAETGVVRVKRVIAYQSAGKVISRKTAESQVIGG